jgi:hypothetical protein
MDPLVIAVADTFMKTLLLSPGLTTGAFLLQNKFQTSCTIVSQWCTLRHRSRKLFMTQAPKSAFLTVRVTDKTHTKFHDKALKIGTPSEVHREIVEAFVEDRLTIQPPVIRKLEKLYVTRTQD